MTNKTKTKRSSSKEPGKNNVKAVTHAYLYDKYLDNMNKVPVSTILTTLYLHGNLLTKIEHLDGAVNLTHLYLQKNRIKKIENLRTMCKLKKLYLGYNEICVVENLEKNLMLEELHIENQNLSKSDSLCFDPRTMYALGRSLQVLNISTNNITTLDSIAPLKLLKNLDASDNNILSTKAIYNGIHNMFYLKEATFSGNPVSKVHRYREDIIGNTFRLECLDGKNVTEMNRCFIKRFEFEKQNFSSKQSLNLGDKVKEISKNYPTLEKAVSASVLKLSSTNDSFELSSDVTSYLPWKKLTCTSVDTTNKVPPLLRKQKKRSQKPPVLNKNVLGFNI